MSLRNETSGGEIAATVELARGFLARLAGLLGRTGIKRDHALVLFHTNSIHMFMMMFTIDVIFVDTERKVLKLCPHRRPFSLPVLALGAIYAIELADGRIAESGVKVGDRLAWD